MATPTAAAVGGKVTAAKYNDLITATYMSDWVTWSTVPTNLAIGTGGSAAMVQRYKYINGRIWFEYSYTLGSSGASMGTSPTINFPLNVKLVIAGGSFATGDGAIRDVSVPSTPAYTKVNVTSATTGIIQTYNGAGGSITATVPMTWAAGDILAGGFWADPA